MVPLVVLTVLLEALLHAYKGSGALFRLCEAPALNMLHALMDNDLGLTVQAATVTNCLLLRDSCHRFLQFRLACHGLPIAAAQLAGAEHVYTAQ